MRGKQEEIEMRYVTVHISDSDAKELVRLAREEEKKRSEELGIDSMYEGWRDARILRLEIEVMVRQRLEEARGEQ